MLAILSIFVALGIASATPNAGCDLAGTWSISSNDGYIGGKVHPVVQTSPGHYNVTMDIRHGPQVVPAILIGGNQVLVHMTPTTTILGTIASNCSYISVNDTSYGDFWCRSWQTGCAWNPPGYGDTVQFWAPIQSNMVLQRGPSQAAVYGIFQGNVTSEPKINVTMVGEGQTITVQAEINTVHQPQYMPGYNTYWTWPGPFPTWKALLPPQKAGGNYTITVSCPSCVNLDPSFRSANITNVTFGDVIYCSGQSNMWLPVGHNFERNYTQNNITQLNKYHNIRIMAGNSGNQGEPAFNPWMDAYTAATTPSADQSCLLFQFGGTCWYTAQRLTDLWEANGDPIIPIGLADTAIGGQRIEEYMDNSTVTQCSQRAGENVPQWDGPLWFKMVVPFVDMTVSSFLWYQGENNMGAVKGNSVAKVGYSCEQEVLIKGWRAVWSKTPNTTPEDAPFGIVTLASSGSEGNPWMGAMRLAQTAGYGVVPNEALPNSFFIQAYDLDDPWGPEGGPCFKEWMCCGKNVNASMCNAGTNGHPEMCDLACAADADTATVMGGIHPRDKWPVGNRLANALYNIKYGGEHAYTGPTLAGCSVSGDQLTVRFNQTLLRGDEVIMQPYNRTLNMSYLEVQTDPSIFCVEVTKVNSSCRSNCALECPSWAGGSSVTNNSAFTGSPDQGWMPINMTLGSDKVSVIGDLTSLSGSAPTAVRYAWGMSECCDKTDPDLYVKYSCGGPQGNTGGTYGPCSLMSSSKVFPANPFIAKIVDGKCECIAPQQCDG